MSYTEFPHGTWVVVNTPTVPDSPFNGKDGYIYAIEGAGVWVWVMGLGEHFTTMDKLHVRASNLDTEVRVAVLGERPRVLGKRVKKMDESGEVRRNREVVLNQMLELTRETK